MQSGETGNVIGGIPHEHLCPKELCTMTNHLRL